MSKPSTDSGMEPIRRATAPPLASAATALARATLAQNASRLASSALTSKYVPALQTATAVADPPGLAGDVKATFSFRIDEPESRLMNAALGKPVIDLELGKNTNPLVFKNISPELAADIKSGKYQVNIQRVDLALNSHNATDLQVSLPGIQARESEFGYGLPGGAPMAHIASTDLVRNNGFASVTPLERPFTDDDAAVMHAHSAAIASDCKGTYMKNPAGGYLVFANTPIANHAVTHPDTAVLADIATDGTVAHFASDAVFEKMRDETLAHLKSTFSLMPLEKLRIRIEPLAHGRNYDGSERKHVSFKYTKPGAVPEKNPVIGLSGNGEVTMRLFQKADTTTTTTTTA